MINSLEHLFCDERLRDPGSFSLEKVSDGPNSRLSISTLSRTWRQALYSGLCTGSTQWIQMETRGSNRIEEKAFPAWGQPSTEMSCADRLYNLHFCRLSWSNSKPRATKSEFSVDPALSKGLYQKPPDIPSNLNYFVIQWFYKQIAEDINLLQRYFWSRSRWRSGMTCLLLPTSSAITASAQQLSSWHLWTDGPRPERKTAALRWRPDPGHCQTHQTTAIFSSTREGMAHALSEVSLTTLPATAELWMQHAVLVSTFPVYLSIRIQILQKKTPKRLFVPTNMQSYFHGSKVNWALGRAASQRIWSSLFLIFTSLKKCYFPVTHT